MEEVRMPLTPSIWRLTIKTPSGASTPAAAFYDLAEVVEIHSHQTSKQFKEQTFRVNQHAQHFFWDLQLCANKIQPYGFPAFNVQN